MDRTGRQQSNHDYWEQAQKLRPLDVAARAEMLAAEDKTPQAYAEFERSLKEVAARYGNPSPQLELTRRRFITFCWSQRAEHGVRPLHVTERYKKRLKDAS